MDSIIEYSVRNISVILGKDLAKKDEALILYKYNKDHL